MSNNNRKRREVPSYPSPDDEDYQAFLSLLTEERLARYRANVANSIVNSKIYDEIEAEMEALNLVFVARMGGPKVNRASSRKRISDVVRSHARKRVIQNSAPPSSEVPYRPPAPYASTDSLTAATVKHSSSSKEARISVRVRNQEGKEIHFRIKRTTKFSKLFQSYADQEAVSEEKMSYGFVFNGNQVREDQTPQMLGMENDAQIEVVLLATSRQHSKGAIPPGTSLQTKNENNRNNYEILVDILGPRMGDYCEADTEGKKEFFSQTLSLMDENGIFFSTKSGQPLLDYRKRKDRVQSAYQSYKQRLQRRSSTVGSDDNELKTPEDRNRDSKKSPGTPPQDDVQRKLPSKEMENDSNEALNTKTASSVLVGATTTTCRSNDEFRSRKPTARTTSIIFCRKSTKNDRMYINSVVVDPESGEFLSTYLEKAKANDQFANVFGMAPTLKQKVDAGIVYRFYAGRAGKFPEHQFANMEASNLFGLFGDSGQPLKLQIGYETVNTDDSADLDVDTLAMAAKFAENTRERTRSNNNSNAGGNCRHSNSDNTDNGRANHPPHKERAEPDRTGYQPGDTKEYEGVTWHYCGCCFHKNANKWHSPHRIAPSFRSILGRTVCRWKNTCPVSPPHHPNPLPILLEPKTTLRIITEGLWRRATGGALAKAMTAAAHGGIDPGQIHILGIGHDQDQGPEIVRRGEVTTGQGGDLRS